MRVINRSGGAVVYSLPELNNTRRVFNLSEVKDIDEKELEALYQLPGGVELIKDSLFVDDKDWVKRHWDAPIEYFWDTEDIKNCLLNDPLDLFEETLDYAPAGVLDIMKALAWQIPLADLNKMNLMMTKLGFDV